MMIRRGTGSKWSKQRTKKEDKKQQNTRKAVDLAIFMINLVANESIPLIQTLWATSTLAYLNECGVVFSYLFSYLLFFILFFCVLKS